MRTKGRIDSAGGKSSGNEQADPQCSRISAKATPDDWKKLKKSLKTARVEASIAGRKVETLVDSGADISFVNASLVKKLQDSSSCKVLVNTFGKPVHVPIRFRSANSSSFKSTGIAEIHFFLGDTFFSYKFMICIA